MKVRNAPQMSNELGILLQLTNITQ